MHNMFTKKTQYLNCAFFSKISSGSVLGGLLSRAAQYSPFKV